MSYAKAAAILANPERYSRREIDRARAMVRDAARNAKRQRMSQPEE